MGFAAQRQSPRDPARRVRWLCETRGHLIRRRRMRSRHKDRDRCATRDSDLRDCARARTHSRRRRCPTTELRDTEVPRQRLSGNETCPTRPAPVKRGRVVLRKVDREAPPSKRIQITTTVTGRRWAGSLAERSRHPAFGCGVRRSSIASEQFSPSLPSKPSPKISRTDGAHRACYGGTASVSKGVESWQPSQ